MGIKKIINVVKVYYNYLIIRFFHKQVINSFPICVTIEPTNICNLRCPECPTGCGEIQRKKGSMSLNAFKYIVDEVSDHTITLNLYFQGEPLLNDTFTEMVCYAKKKGLKVETSTNGHFLHKKASEEIVKSGLDKIIISLDGTNQSTYSLYRIGGNFETVIEGINNIVEMKNKYKSKFPAIILQFLVLKTNEHQINDIKELGKKLKVDKVELKSAQIYHNENVNIFLPLNNKYARYRKNDNNELSIKCHLKNRCLRLFTHIVITWDCFVVPCCYDKDAKCKFGNLQNDFFIDILKSKKRKDFINSVFTDRKNISMCLNCGEQLYINN